jgi:hypothetical protein
MTWISPLPIIIWVILVLPLTLTLWKYPPRDKLTAVIVLVDYGIFNLLSYLTINWVIFYYYLSILPWVLTFAMVLRYISFHYHTPYLPIKAKAALTYTFVASSFLVFLGLSAYYILSSFVHKGDHVLMEFPLRAGLNVIVNGGNGREGYGMNNRYHTWPGSGISPDITKSFGIDIMEMSIGGLLGTDSKLKREKVQDFLIYLDNVYAPCFGPVIHVEDGVPDAELNKADSNLGNYIVIQCVDYFVTLGNLKNGTILVKPGDYVRISMMLAKVGNSAKPGIPHLHLHATTGGWKEGEGNPVPMLFAGDFAINDFMTRNELVLPK